MIVVLMCCMLYCVINWCVFECGMLNFVIFLISVLFLMLLFLIVLVFCLCVILNCMVFMLWLDLCLISLSVWFDILFIFWMYGISILFLNSLYFLYDCDVLFWLRMRLWNFGNGIFVVMLIFL